MFTLFSRIILSNSRSLLTLFFVILFASTGFVTLRQITTNIESLVASETRPLFGADLMVSPRGYASGDILPLVSPFLYGETFVAAERREFSTTLLDTNGSPGLVKVVTYSGTYPQRGILTTRQTLMMSGMDRVAATPGLRDKFSSGGILSIDGRSLTITEEIIESSDLGFSLGTENHLLLLPIKLLSGSLLLSSGSRLDHDLMISFDDERRARDIALKLKGVLNEDDFRIRTYEERTERNLETVETLTDYITLILLVSSIFAFIILRSAHESFYENLARTLSIAEMLGLTRKRKRLLFLMLYGMILPLATLISLGIAGIIVESMKRIPEAAEFQFFFSALPEAVLLLVLIVVMAWFPIWYRMSRVNEEKESRFLDICKDMPLIQKIELYAKNSIMFLIQRDIIVPLLLSVAILMLLFSDIVFALLVTLGAGIFFMIFGYSLRLIYEWIFRKMSFLRKNKFYQFDALRALVRPLTPTIPISISLVSITIFFLVFATFSLSFRSKLALDSTNTANIYAINILESDKDGVEDILGSGALMYDILRARITRINEKTLEEHFDVERVSGEFTREFNITTTSLPNRVLAGKKEISSSEVSIDQEFSKSLGVKLGDKVEFLLSGRKLTLTIANIRESVREGFLPFFYFSFNTEEFSGAPRTYFVAEYASDTEVWKQDILKASGPHVTFIDIESILKIVRDISTKVLSVIGLFFALIFLFAIGAIIAFFVRLRPLEDMKKKLYSLFGASSKDIKISTTGTRLTIFVVSYVLSIILGGILSYIVLTMGGFFRFSYVHFFLLSGLVAGIYSILAAVMRR